MVPTLGRTLILLALLAASAGSIVGFATGARPNAAGWKWARRLAYAFAAFMALANLTMEYALLTHDFSVSYVAHVGSRAVPTWVSIVSLWSSLEGSILFWGLVMGVYVAVATWRKADEHPEYMPYAVGVWLACGAFFSFLLAGPAQPFGTIPNPPLDGPGPNPLLQNHYLMVIHPPFLYSGYVGMTIPFGLACAALLVGRLGNDFIRPLRNFLLTSWIFLTCAIVLGGWWAYEVLGWGGYWAWDPVENASFLPWLTATAALHSALLVERKGVLKGWTVILVLATYLLTILGTFMTRSGVFNSVHSFTQSAIGPTILVFLAAALLFSLVLLALRVDSLGSDGRLETGPSRDVMFLVQNLLFVLFTFTVLLGTVFPLVVEALRGLQMSVGRPYFDKMSVPTGVALLFVMGVGPALPWGRATRQQLRSALLPPLVGAGALAAVGLALGVRNVWTLLALLFGGFTAQVTLSEMFLPVRQRMRTRGEGLAEAFRQAQTRGRRRFGAYVVHAGAVVVIAAIAVSSTMGSSKEIQLNQGQTTTLGAYQLTFVGAEQVSEPHRESVRARVEISKNGRSLGTLYPRMSTYENQREPIGSPAVHTSLTEDLYLSIHNIDGAAGTVGLLVLVNPMVCWIWIATAIMALGGLVALVPPLRGATAAAPAPGASAIAMEGSS
ncbi:MAG: cytochrome C biogenesis protein CcmF [Chloroflexi bacterium 13_1_40CM_2_68_14]|nr:MAG: cytochrome C biogenesis protein CcmF [Deltaproteobacteria bacterium 13_1_40CM_3_69_14]OLD48283.1 MAG: cytochrome C biogenesis protein CcmF [Chloroflexi bacterium 13_1_40CM_2_68_14]